MRSTILLVVFSFFVSNLVAQQTPFINNPPADSTEAPNNPVSILENIGIDRSFELTLSCVVIGFGIIVLGIEAFLSAKGIIKSEHTFKCLIITLVIIGSLLLITAGYSNVQINGITGLLGSIAGYLLAKTDSKDNQKSTNNDEKR